MFGTVMNEVGCKEFFLGVNRIVTEPPLWSFVIELQIIPCKWLTQHLDMGHLISSLTMIIVIVITIVMIMVAHLLDCELLEDRD